MIDNGRLAVNVKPVAVTVDVETIAPEASIVVTVNGPVLVVPNETVPSAVRSVKVATPGLDPPITTPSMVPPVITTVPPPPPPEDGVVQIGVAPGPCEVST